MSRITTHRRAGDGMGPAGAIIQIDPADDVEPPAANAASVRVADAAGWQR